MKKELITRLHKNLEHCAHQQDVVEYWDARELQTLFGYSEWRNLLLVIDKAKIACVIAKQAVDGHFADVGKMVDLGSGRTQIKSKLKVSGLISLQNSSAYECFQ